MNTQRILDLLKLDARQDEIAVRLKVKRATLLKKLQRMAKKGLVKGIGKTTNRYYVLSNVQSPKLVTSEAAIYKDKPKLSPSKLRLHRLHRSYELLEQPSIEGKEIRLNNNEQKVIVFDGLTLRITTQHIVVEGLELYSDYGILAPELLLFAERQADGVILHASQNLALKLKSMRGTTSIMEIGLTEQKDVIKKARTKGIIPLYWNASTGKVEVWGDMSLNIGEIESNKIHHAETLRANFKPILDKRWSTEDQLKINQQVIEEMQVLKGGIEEFHRWLEHHDAKILADTRLVRALTTKINQKKLFE